MSHVNDASLSGFKRKTCFTLDKILVCSQRVVGGTEKQLISPHNL